VRDHSARQSPFSQGLDAIIAAKLQPQPETGKEPLPTKGLPSEDDALAAAVGLELWALGIQLVLAADSDAKG